MQVCRAVSVGPKQVLTITLKCLLVKILNYPEISRLRFFKKKKNTVSAAFAQMGRRIFHHNRWKTQGAS